MGKNVSLSIAAVQQWICVCGNDCALWNPAAETKPLDMTSVVEMPLWLLVLLLSLAAIATLDRIIGPGLRWFLRRRMERAVEELNKRLERPIRPFKLMRRQDQVIRLIHDPHVMEAVDEYARTEGVPHNVAFDRARSYAREIVPGFSTATYFGFAIRVARRLSQGLYKVRLGRGDDQTLRAIDPRSAVVFVMNHRSNMDYVLVTWLAADRSALSYAVGEWARVWPLKALIRATGAYFIRRRYSSTLYRAVLARYVQMSIAEGVTQAMFPEGGLSLNGAVGRARKGLLHYIVRDFSMGSGRDVVFVPVALNYDRVLEDRVLLKAAEDGTRRFRVSMGAVLGFVARVLWQKARGRFRQFGYAAVCYGTPVSLRAFLENEPGASTEALADVLMQRIRAAVPMLPVPLAAAALVRCEGNTTRDALIAQGVDLALALQRKGAYLHLPGTDAAAAMRAGLDALLLRAIVTENDGRIRIAPGQGATLGYYAASVLQRLAEDDDPARPAAATLQLPKAGET
ncbi:MAG: glycerol-3-phosphate O-acyltransferase PlsB [Rhodobacteraceae bacterium HLUCCA12]|nr:MAG: glycerol-3-phosphate O-acyltransferase PlsB [Rhodobacteraceae bacterium HLUCCA12]